MLHFLLQLTAERVALQRTAKETESIRATMQGFVSAEKEKFERLANKMKNKEKDLAIKSQKLKQVEELIKNSPCTTRNPLKDTNKGLTSAEEPAHNEVNKELIILTEGKEHIV